MLLFVIADMFKKDTNTYAATRRDGDLYRVPAGLAHFFQVQRFVRGFVLAAVNDERRRVHRHLHARRPVSVHLPVLVMEAFQL